MQNERRSRGVQITDPEIALFEIRAGHQMYNGSHCLPAGHFRDWPVSRLLNAVERGVIYTAELRRLK